MARLAFAAQEMLKRDNDHVVIEIRVLGPLELLRRALPVLRQLGAYRLIEYLDSCAGLALAQGEPETAARSALGGQRLDRLHQDGRGHTIEQALDLALDKVLLAEGVQR
ncbi:MAG: hypothetical protein H0U77_11645 [Nocardioidaceae bacterium]|nr:hypothetical protein [Nocardioidaceae bacterium]